MKNRILAIAIALGLMAIGAIYLLEDGVSNVKVVQPEILIRLTDQQRDIVVNFEVRNSSWKQVSIVAVE